MVKEAKKALELPKQQLLILALCRIAEPVAMTSVYPYIVSQTALAADFLLLLTNCSLR